MTTEEKQGVDAMELEDLFFKKVLRDFRDELSNNKYLVAAYCVLVVVIAVAVAFNQPLYYRATATLLVDASAVQDPSEQRNLGNLELQAAIIQSPEVVEKVIQKTNLLTEPFYARKANPREAFLGFLKAETEKNNNTIQIRFLDTSAEQAALIANEMARAFLQSKAAKSSGVNVESMGSLKEQGKQEMEKLSLVKTKIAELNKVNPELGNEEALDDQIKFLNNEYNKTDANVLQLNTTISELEMLIQNGGSIESNPYAASHPRVRSKLDRLRDAELETVQLEQEYREMHPAVLKAKTKLKALRQSIEEEKVQLLAELKAAEQTGEATRQKLRSSILQLQTQEKELTPQKLEYRNLISEESSITETIKLLNAQISKTSVAASYKGVGIEILSYATVPQHPFTPNKPKIFFLAVVFALFSSLGFIFLRCYMDRSFRRDEDIEEVLMRPFLGHLPFVRVDKDGITPIFKSEKESVYFSNFLRLACANMSFLNTEKTGKATIMVTSSRPGEGKTFVSYYLAQTYAKDGRKTVMVDTDFCRSSLSFAFPQRGKGCPGLHDYLMGRADAEQILEVTEQKNLFLIRSEEAEFSAPHALRSERMKELLRTLKDQFDIVLLDAPPTLAVSDAMALGALVDMRVFVIEWGKTPRDMVRRAITRVAPGKQVSVGVILNKVKNVSGSYYSQYQHYYSGKKETRDRNSTKAS